MDQQNNWGRNQTPATVRVRGNKLFNVTCLSEYLYWAYFLKGKQKQR